MGRCRVQKLCHREQMGVYRIARGRVDFSLQNVLFHENAYWVKIMVKTKGQVGPVI